MRIRGSLRMKVIISFVAITFVVVAVASYNYMQVEKIKTQIEMQNEQTAKQLQALELIQKAEQLSSMAAGLAVSGDLSVEKQYEEEKERFLALVNQVGEQAATRDQRRWRTSLNVTSGEFVQQFNKIATILRSDLPADERFTKLQQQYKLSQAHIQYIYQLTDNFHRIFTEDAEKAKLHTMQLLAETVRILIIAIAIVAVLSVTVSTLIIRSFADPLSKLQSAMRRMSEGDLRERLDSARTDELGQLSRSFDDMTNQMAQMLANANEIAGVMKQLADSFENNTRSTVLAGDEIMSAIEGVSISSDQQIAQAELSITKATELNQHVLSVRDIAEQIMKLSQDTVLHTGNGSEAVQILTVSAKQTVDQLQHIVVAMDSLAGVTREIGTITTTIEDIANQTNLLAINASIEAGHAGEHGRGFAVIAGQVRELSDETKQSSRHIHELIDSLRKQTMVMQSHIVEAIQRFRVQHGAIEQTTSAFGTIQDSAKRLADNLDDIHHMIESTIEKNRMVLASFEIVLTAAEENAASVQEVHASLSKQDQALKNIASESVSVKQVADQLSSWMRRFQV